jgi:hypothetical protein
MVFSLFTAILVGLSPQRGAAAPFSCSARMGGAVVGWGCWVLGVVFMCGPHHPLSLQGDTVWWIGGIGWIGRIGGVGA